MGAGGRTLLYGGGKCVVVVCDGINSQSIATFVSNGLLEDWMMFGRIVAWWLPMMQRWIRTIYVWGSCFGNRSDISLVA